MNTTSKYSALVDTTEKLVQLKAKNLDDLRRINVIKTKIKNIDSDTALEIEEIKNTPIDNDLVKEQAKFAFDSALVTLSTEVERKKVELQDMFDDTISECESEIKEAESIIIQSKRDIEKAKRDLITNQRSIARYEEKGKIEAQQAYDRELATVGNSDKTMEIRIQKAKRNAQRKKQEFQNELDVLLAKETAENEVVDLRNRLYKDIIDISMKIGDK